mgnify:CR=1 FL=1
MKKLLPTIIGVITLVVLAGAIAFFQPWKRFLDTPLLSPGTALTVNLMRGKAEVYLDDKKVGETPFSSEDLEPGDHTLELRRMSEEQDFYITISKQVHLEPNTRTLIEAEIGPDEQFSSYNVIYYRKRTSAEASVYVKTTPSKAEVTVDDLNFGDSPVSNDTLSPGKHEIVVSKEGYQDEQATFIVREGYTLIAEFDLMAKPIDLEQE